MRFVSQSDFCYSSFRFQGEEYINILPALVTSLSTSGFLTDHLALPHSPVEDLAYKKSDRGSKHNGHESVAKKQRGSTEEADDPNTKGEKKGYNNTHKTENIHSGRYVRKGLLDAYLTL